MITMLCKFPPVRLLRPVRLLIYSKFPNGTVNRAGTAIRDLRVHKNVHSNVWTCLWRMEQKCTVLEACRPFWWSLNSKILYTGWNRKKSTFTIRRAWRGLSEAWVVKCNVCMNLTKAVQVQYHGVETRTSDDWRVSKYTKCKFWWLKLEQRKSNQI